MLQDVDDEIAIQIVQSGDKAFPLNAVMLGPVPSI
tara:strand:- start:331 stop:435 length:105 start_codon:yes stop_codon:yes gene_type:complete